MLRRIFAVGALFASVATLAITAGPVFSADSGTVNATVTVTSPCLTVPETVIDYGNKGFASVTTGDSTAVGAEFLIESCSADSQSVSVSGAEMKGSTAVWNLSTNVANTTCFQEGAGQTVTLNAYRHEIMLSHYAEPTTLTMGNSLLGVMSPSGTPGWKSTPKLYMPCAGSDGVGQTMSTTITFTASY